jgi:hypothetical protein
MGVLQPSLTVEDAAFDFEIQYGDTRETAIISSSDLECCLQVCSARRIASAIASAADPLTSVRLGSPLATPKTVKVVNSGADFLTRRATQMASRFHDAAKILLATSPVWTLMTTAAD